MSLLESDTGVRAAPLISSWGIASSGDTWTVAAGSASALSTTTRALKITGASNVNMVIGPSSVQDVSVSVQSTVQNASDSPVILMRYTDNNNYIKIDVSGGLLRLRKNVSPTGFTNVATVAFTLTPNTLYQIVFQISGTAYSAKIYPVGTTDPGWMVTGTASDAILASGKWGLSATSASLPVQYNAFTVNGLRADNPYNVEDNPYGVTVYSSNASRIALPQLITDMQTLGITWLRYQQNGASLDNPQGTYTWTGLDDIVSRCNAAGINIIYGLDQPPSWGIDGTTGLPTPAYTTTIATQVATRYNGSSGHGHLDAIEIWNEEFDVTSYTNTTYAAVASAGYTAIRGAGFTGKIGCAAMLGISSTGHVTSWVNQLYASAISSLFDYYSLHYYNSNHDPSVTDSSFISIDSALQTIDAALIAQSDALKPLWITEFGYATSTNGGHSAGALVTELVRNQNYAYIVNSAHSNSQQSGNGCVAKIMFFSMDTDPANTDGESITQGLTTSETYTQTFNTFTGWIDAYYMWPGGVAIFPPIGTRSGVFPSATRRGS